MEEKDWENREMEPPFEVEEIEEEAPVESQEEAPVEKGSAAWYAEDREAFVAAHPEVGLESLLEDGCFLDFADGKVGNIPLAEIYEGYCRWKDALAVHRKTALVDSARKRSPGSLRATHGAAVGEFFTLQEMQAMSADEIEAHWDKVQKSIKKLSK